MSLQLPSHRRQETLEELIDKASEATTPPPPPKGGIPKQRVPSWIRTAIQCIVLPFVFLDYWMQKIAKMIIRPPYKQVGSCQQRGNCCHFILIPTPISTLEKLHYLWNTEINGFFPRDSSPVEYEGDEMVVLGCRYLQKNGSCANYRLRPMICRQWPIIEHFGKPQILKGCGFHAVPRDEPDNKLKVINNGNPSSH